MARISEQVLAGLARPTMAQGMFDLGAAIGGVPGQIKQKRRQDKFNEIMKRGQAALASAEPDPVVLSGIAQELQAMGYTKEAQQFSEASRKRGERAAQIARVGGLLTQVSEGPLTTKDLSSYVGTGGDIQDVSAVLAAKKAITPPPFLTQEQEFDLLSKGYSNENIQKYKTTRNLVDLGKPKGKTPEAGFTITEWVDDSGKVVERTLQDKDARTIRVGDRSLVTTEDLRNLKIRSKPSSVVNVTSAQESQLAKDLGGGIAKEVIQASTDAREAENNLSLIAEARIVANERPEIFGAGANEINSARKGTQRVMQLLGVPETDSTYREIANATSATDVVNAFTQDFVRTRLEATKGAISDMEFRTFIASVPNLLSSPEGYQQLLNFMEAANTRTVLRGAALSKAGADSQKIQTVKNKWSAFTRDFPATSFIPSDDVEKLWRMYEGGKVNKKNLSFSTNIIDSEGNPTGERRTFTYKQLEDMSKSQENPIAAMLLLRRLYLKEGADTRFVMPN